MNASDRPNTCKSRGSISSLLEDGDRARVSNAYATYLILGDSPEKSGLIPHNNVLSHGKIFKTPVV